MRPLLVLLLVLLGAAALGITILTLGDETKPAAGPAVRPGVASPAGARGTAPTMPSGPVDVVTRSDSPEAVTEQPRETIDTASVGAFPNELAGTITDCRSGAPVRDAEVLIIRDHVPSANPFLKVLAGQNRESGPRRKTRTDDKGNFRFRGLEPGKTYGMFVSGDGFSRTELTVILGQDETRHQAVCLSQGSSVTGFVFDKATTRPIPNAMLVLESPLARVLKSPDADLDRFVTTTDERGHYSLENIPPGEDRHLLCEAKGYGSQIKTEIVLEGKLQELKQDFHLELGKTLAGSVSGQDGTRIGGALVEALSYQQAPSCRATTISADDGQFLLEGLADGVYTLMVSAKGWTNERVVRVELDGSSVEILMQPQAVVVGRIVDAGTGRPVRDFQIAIRQTSGEGGWHGRPLATANFRSREDGSFSLEGINKGLYVIQATAKGYAESLSDRFDVSPGGTSTEVIVQMNQGGTLSGTVVDANSGEPVEGAVVTTHDSGWIDTEFTRSIGSFAPRMTTFREAHTDAAGRYVLERMAPGQYQVRVNHASYTEDVRNDLTVTVGTDNGLGTTRMRAGGTISGTVFDSDGKPVAGSEVLMLPAGVAGIAGLSYRVVTNSQGRFAIRNAATGSYKLSASKGATGRGNPFQAIVEMRNSEVEMTVGEGGAYARDLYLGP